MSLLNEFLVGVGSRMGIALIKPHWLTECKTPTYSRMGGPVHSPSHSGFHQEFVGIPTVLQFTH